MFWGCGSKRERETLEGEERKRKEFSGTTAIVSLRQLGPVRVQLKRKRKLKRFPSFCAVRPL